MAGGDARPTSLFLKGEGIGGELQDMGLWGAGPGTLISASGTEPAPRYRGGYREPPE